MTALSIAKAIWSFLRGLPWQLWAVAGMVLAVWLYGGHRYDAGVAAENARWVEAQAKADEEAKATEAKRDKAAGTINDKTAGKAEQAQASTRDETAQAVERVRYVTRTIDVPAGCPVELPQEAVDEGRKAVERARAAGAN